jgi:signal peptidase II
VTDSTESLREAMNHELPKTAAEVADVGDPTRGGAPAPPINPTVAGARLRVVAVAVGVIIADQLTKSWAVDRLSNDRIINVLGPLRFNLAFNKGMAFSRGQGAGPLLSVVAVVVVVVLLRRPPRRWWPVIATGGIIGGATGNVIDRAFRGGLSFFRNGVVDFIDLQKWPIFNVADIGVTVGAAVLIIASLREPQ